MQSPYNLTKDYDKAADIIARAFDGNPFNAYVGRRCSLEESTAGFKTRLIQLVTQADTYIAEADDFTSIAVWIPPEHLTPEFPEPMDDELRETEEGFKRCREKYLQDRPHWHLTILVKDPSRSPVKGSTSKTVRPFLERAKEQGVPCVLEAVDERAREIYLHYGFKEYETMTFGVGKVDEQGNPDPKGKGVKAYYMIYNLE